MEMAAARQIGPNAFEFDTIKEAEIFAHVLQSGRRKIQRRGRVVHVLSRVPRADIEWADANAFKYGGRTPRRERDPADPTVRMYRGYELISRYSTIHPRSHAWSARIWNPTKGRSLGPIFFFGRTEPAVLKRARRYIDQFADHIERGGQAPPERDLRREAGRPRRSSKRDWWQRVKTAFGAPSRSAAPEPPRRTREPLTSVRRVPFGSEGLYDTSHVGSIRLPYSALVRLFGNPDEGDGGKTHFNWQLEGDQGSPWTIYDQEAREGRSAAETRQAPSISWNIGGEKSPRDVVILKRLLRRAAPRTAVHKKRRRRARR